jgi:hypothetical protein
VQARNKEEGNDGGQPAGGTGTGAKKCVEPVQLQADSTFAGENTRKLRHFYDFVARVTVAPPVTSCYRPARRIDDLFRLIDPARAPSHNPVNC